MVDAPPTIAIKARRNRKPFQTLAGPVTGDRVTAFPQKGCGYKPPLRNDQGTAASDPSLQPFKHGVHRVHAPLALIDLHRFHRCHPSVQGETGPHQLRHLPW